MEAMLGLALLCGHGPTSREWTATIDQAGPHIRVGEIIVVGNTETPQCVIMDQLPFAAGWQISQQELKQAEANLRRLNLFRIDIWNGERPRVEVIDPDGPHEFKSILVSIEEKRSNRLRYALIELMRLPMTGGMGYSLRQTLINPTGTIDFLWTKHQDR